MKIVHAAIASLLLVGLTMFATAEEVHTKDSLETVQKNLAEDKAVLLDVREEAEWNAGHLRDARLVPLSLMRRDLDKATQSLKKETIIYCHCRSGFRVLTAHDILKPLGYDVRPLKQGYQDLLKAGFKKAE